MGKIFHNCTYNVSGCAFPAMCHLCGFDRSEIERRKEIPLTPDEKGRLRKIIPWRDAPKTENQEGKS